MMEKPIDVTTQISESSEQKPLNITSNEVMDCSQNDQNTDSLNESFDQDLLENQQYVNKLSFQNIVPVSLCVRDLSVATKQKISTSFFGKKKTNPITDPKTPPVRPILDSTSFDLPSGSLMAIIGGSGSGKTTLLNVLANRSSSSNLSQTGSVLYNGSSLSKVRNAYVIQQDVLSPSLTTRETLQFATELRLPDLTNNEERLRLVEEVILELGLKDCANTVVGDSTHKGLSGGEKRRLSIGIQLLSNPSLLFLDEPTTGLDAHSAFLLIKTLKNLSKRGRTIIVSIHQPRSDIFFLFDYLCILSQGQTVYNGSVHKVLDYFHDLSYDVPFSVNPADFLIDITTVDLRTKQSEEKGIARLATFTQHWKSYQQVDPNPQFDNFKINHQQDVPNSKVPFLRELTVLIRRTSLLTIRDRATFFSLITEATFMGIICGWVFYKPGDSLAGIRTIGGALYSANGLQGYLMLLFETYRLTASDIKIFDRERADNCVSVPGFLLSRRISKFFTEDILISLSFSVITYFMFGLVPEARNFFIYWMNLLLVHCASMTFAMFSVAISRNFANASLVANLNYTLQSFACGFFINAKIMPVYVRWTKYIAFLWYGFGALISNQFTGFFGDCPSGDPNDVSCYIYQGKYIIESYGFWEDWIAVPLIVVLSYVILFYISAGVVLYLKKVDISMSKQVKSVVSYEERDPTEIEDTGKETIEDDEYIDMTLSNVYLSVKLGQKFRKKTEKVILEDVTASFKAGKLNAIMGPSGSGKSSLLNLISGRLGSDIANEYSFSGDICFNDFKVRTGMINKMCSYVSQDDDHLLSSLSVRETLRLAADLRIKNRTSEQKHNIVEGIINKLGLKACANTLIGSEFIKGISGGEKRRVSIGIQLLTNPKILLLDEPTSGLDSFTASSILEILQGLAHEGKTIILTIHQPRSDLFNRFGQVLLLAKGGVVGYNGEQSKMLEYFSNLGYPCPKLTNSADHVLDLISVNNQSVHNETISKKRIDSLLSFWRDDERNFILVDGKRELTMSEFDQRYKRFIRTPAKFLIAFYSCLKQFTLTTFRDINVIFGRIFNVLGLGVILCLFTAQLQTNYESIQTRLGLLQQFTALYFSGMLNNLSSYPQQRDYFYHEYNDRVYGVAPFLLSYTLVEIPFEIFTCIIFSTLAGMATGLPRTPEFFFTVIYVCWMICLCGESLGIITNTLFKHAGFAVNSVSVILAIGSFMAGVMSLTMDSVLKGFNYLSPLKYGLSIVINMGFPPNLHFTCNADSQNADGSCIFANGTDVLVQYGLYNGDYNKYFGILVSVAVIYRLLAYLLLRLKLWKFELQVFKKSNHYTV